MSISFEVSVEATCEKCGDELIISFKGDTSTRYSNRFAIEVEPCHSCLEKAREEAAKENTDGT